MKQETFAQPYRLVPPLPRRPSKMPPRNTFFAAITDSLLGYLGLEMPRQIKSFDVKIPPSGGGGGDRYSKSSLAVPFDRVVFLKGDCNRFAFIACL